MLLFVVLVIVCSLGGLVQSKALLSFFNADYFDTVQYQNKQSTIDLQEWLSFKYPVSVYFTDMEMGSISASFDISADNLWSMGKIPVITWMAERNNASWNAQATVLLGSGSEDAYLKAYLSRLRTFISGPDGILGTVDDRRAFIRLAHEMNGGWYPYSQNQNTPSSYIKMWQHIVTMTREDFNMSSDQVAYMWCVDTVDGIAGEPAEHWYPGSDFVDWVAIDGYNPGTTMTNGMWIGPGIIFSEMISRMEKLGKPIAIPEFGSVPRRSPGEQGCAPYEGMQAKAWWISEALSLFKQHSSIGLISYFNINKEDPGSVLGQAWAVLSTSEQNADGCSSLCFCSEGLGKFTASSNISYNVFPGFQQRIASDNYYWIPSDAEKPKNREFRPIPW